MGSREKGLQILELFFKRRLKDDEVTKFALRNKNLEVFFKEGTAKLKENALACLAKHEAVAKRINCIREQIPDWEYYLPLLIDSFGKKKMRKKHEKMQSDKMLVKVVRVKKDETPKAEKNLENAKKFSSKDQKRKKVTESSEGNDEKIEKKDDDDDDDDDDDMVVKDNCGERNKEKWKMKEHVRKSLSEPETKFEKIDDPFFVQKKVIAPKLLLEKPIGKVEKSKDKRESSSVFHVKPFQAKRDSKFDGKFQCSSRGGQEEEKLHPSWVAKKVKFIKPFQGKKIKFSED